MPDKHANIRGSSLGAKKVGRRNFLGASAAAAAAIPLRPVLGSRESVLDASIVPYNADSRKANSYALRVAAAAAERIDVGVQPDNGDARRFSDFSGNYTKAMLHDALGVPNKAAIQSLIKASQTGEFSDFENILVGTLGGGPNSKENGPQGGLAFDLEGRDSHATVIPPAPSVASAESAAEAVEHYWGALLRDVPFTEYGSNSLVGQAVADMNRLSFLRSVRNYEYPVPVTAQKFVSRPDRSR